MCELITVDKEKCNGCHSCISACPVKVCIDASGDTVETIDKLCLGCGRCIPACKQGARSYTDDTEQFFNDLAAGEKIAAIVAPASAAVFGDIAKLNGYLKSTGVKAVFDVSFGAELTVKSYLDYANKNRPRLIIAQPCAAIVTYCEVFHPELLKFLAPAHSPMLHTAIMIKKFFPEYRDYKIAAISPCAAKKREFAETGLIEYNVTMLRLKERIAAEKIKLPTFPALPYDGPRAERAALFSTPGGLRDTIAREAPGLVPLVRKIEGPDIVYKYLDELPEMLKEDNAPFIVDCLSCEAGCNGGPGTGNYGEPVDRLEAHVSKRAAAQIERNKKTFMGGALKRAIKKYWRANTYTRKYENSGEYGKRIKKASEQELRTVFLSMKKDKPEDMLNCSACGYGSCRAMAEMIFNGLNKKEHCFYYVMSKLAEDEKIRSAAIDMANHLVFQIENSKETLISMRNEVSKYIEATMSQGESIDKSGGKMSSLITQIQTVSAAAEQKREALEELGRSTERAKKDMRALSTSFAELENTTREIDGIADVIEDVATSTNLLAMNAAIEAAHAGESGKGFAVVASEIRALSVAASDNTNSISSNIKNIIKQINSSMDFLNKMDAVMERMIEGVTNVGDSFNSIIQSHSSISDSTRELTEDLNSMNASSENLRNSSKDIIEALKTIGELINSLDAAADSAKSGGSGPSLNLF
ncbi:MAG: methyl-accepting chemotaxis protein [Spirochaetaceae bacterium]|jgi:iron only hydrogenase large subunit-like protein/archaellum component FlaC|nr:methyl-accepting chemotaxis protein [Spirochaetaceae bacterium]